MSAVSCAANAAWSLSSGSSWGSIALLTSGHTPSERPMISFMISVVPP
jgi:hypothetical protein